MAKQKNKKRRYALENNGRRIVEITGDDSRIGKRVIMDFQPYSVFDEELLLKKLKSLHKRHNILRRY